MTDDHVEPSPSRFASDLEDDVRFVTTPEQQVEELLERLGRAGELHLGAD